MPASNSWAEPEIWWTWQEKNIIWKFQTNLMQCSPGALLMNLSLFCWSLTMSEVRVKTLFFICHGISRHHHIISSIRKFNCRIIFLCFRKLCHHWVVYLEIFQLQSLTILFLIQKVLISWPKLSMQTSQENILNFANHFDSPRKWRIFLNSRRIRSNIRRWKYIFSRFVLDRSWPPYLNFTKVAAKIIPLLLLKSSEHIGFHVPFTSQVLISCKNILSREQ